MRTQTETKKTSDELFAETIIEMLKAGTAPWQREWDINEALMMPYQNAISKVAYKGANILRLYVHSLKMGFSDPRWVTFNQAKEKGWYVMKGAKGTQVAFFKRYQKEEQNEDGETELESRFAKKIYTVFNASQINGIEALPESEKHEWDPIEIGESILNNSCAHIEYNGKDRAFYNPHFDSIHLPERNCFKDAGGFYSTAIHELAHWTGHENRLNRKLANSRGTEDYAREELRAEIASWMISAATGLPFSPENHASYVNGWIKAIKEDYKEIYRACADAEKIKTYLLELAGFEQELVA